MPEHAATGTEKKFTLLAYLDDFGGPDFVIRHADGRLESVSPEDGYRKGTPLAVQEDYDLLLSEHGYMPCAEPKRFETPDELEKWAASKAYKNV